MQLAATPRACTVEDKWVKNLRQCSKGPCPAQGAHAGGAGNVAARACAS